MSLAESGYVVKMGLLERLQMISMIYDLQFDEAERRQIDRLRHIDAKRVLYSCFSGIAVLILVFSVQIPFRGVDWLHSFATYGCTPIGIAAGLYVNHWIDRYVENQFKHKWDPLFYERKGSTPAQEAARDEIIGLTDDLRFYALPESEQRKAMQKINRKYGL